MLRSVSGHAAGMVLVLALCAAGCQRPAAADKPAPPAPAAAVAAPVEPPGSWTDPRAVAELARNCAFDPDSLQGEERTRWLGESIEPSPFSCAAVFEHSDLYDPCFDQQDEKCGPRCAATCTACGKDCAGRCEACKQGCRDDACRQACALRCAECRQGCARAGNRCATSTCAAEYRQCRERLRQDWQKNGCPRTCKPYAACRDRCMRKADQAGGHEDCRARCKPRRPTPCDLELCPGDYGVGIDPESAP